MSKLIKMVSSQYKHLPTRGDADIDPRVITRGSFMRNEPFSFQVLYRAPKGKTCMPVTLYAETALPIESFRVDLVPVLHTRAVAESRGVESHLPGLFPDVLMPRPAKPELCGLQVTEKDTYWQERDVDNLLNATDREYQAVWFTVNPESQVLSAGEYSVCVTLKELKTGEVLDTDTLTLCVCDECLPEHSVYYTNWFHVDCVCDLFDVKPYSNAFYKIFDRYVTNMVRHRQNTLLLPAFTPPLDTPIGGERMNVQLVEVTRTRTGWQFGFDQMRRYIRRAKKCGIRFFEHSHLFSQWGAHHAPNVYEKSGARLFGFDTDAAGEEYRAFIRAYLKDFFAFAEKEGIRKSTVFHISDEPALEDLESYRRAYSTVADLLDGAPVADAMFHPDFYKEGLVNNPIAMAKYADRFEECDGLWLYYTGGEGGGAYANRLIPQTAARTRVLGLHMYRYGARGFLQWGYNYYYDFRSTGIYDPNISVGGYRMYPGAAHLCYPVLRGKGRGVVPSVREKLMCEAMDDLRALRLLESRIGREATLAMCEQTFGTLNAETMPEGEALRLFREKVNKAIMAAK